MRKKRAEQFCKYVKDLARKAWLRNNAAPTEHDKSFDETKNAASRNSKDITLGKKHF